MKAYALLGNSTMHTSIAKYLEISLYCIVETVADLSDGPK
jgi:hypothetical protein